MRRATKFRRRRRRHGPGGGSAGPPAEAGSDGAPEGVRGTASGGGRPAGTAGSSGVLLAWARDREGLRVRATDLDPGRRRERAPFTCPTCREPLTPRLGDLRARHFAHRPGSGCPLTAPETALHWNVKELLLALCEQAFAGRRRVRLLARCPGCRRPVPDMLDSFGDSAASEAIAGPLRCDVLVFRGGAPSLAFEVRVSHAVDATKEAGFAALGLPALEIDARADWLHDSGSGVVAGVVHYSGSGVGPHDSESGEGVAEISPARTLGFPRCGACQTEERARAGRDLGGDAAAVAELESYRARGLLGPPPERPVEGSDPIGPADRARLAGTFRCAHCGGASLEFGDRIVRHRCPGQGPRAVAWRGYDGRLVELAWWKRA